jgi:hypothetical protein
LLALAKYSISIIFASAKASSAWSGIEAAAKFADDERLEARRRLEEAKAKLDEMDGRDGVGQGGDGAPISSLVAILAELRADDHAARARLAVRSRATHLDTLADRLRELRPWAGAIDELVDMMAPEASRIEGWKIATTQAQTHIEAAVQFPRDGKSFQSRNCAALERLTRPPTEAPRNRKSSHQKPHAAGLL